jgi:hypothetical protein
MQVVAPRIGGFTTKNGALTKGRTLTERDCSTKHIKTKAWIVQEFRERAKAP